MISSKKARACAETLDNIKGKKSIMGICERMILLAETLMIAGKLKPSSRPVILNIWLKNTWAMKRPSISGNTLKKLMKKSERPSW
jgi:hypothetical protein